MSRLILTDQDLSGKTIEGQPFSYIGSCTGTDIKFTGDWTHVSHFGNTFLRPDWSKARTRWSYSRFNTFTDAKPSLDVELLDHDMMVAVLEEGLLGVTGKVRTGLQKVIDGLKGKYLASWSNLSPLFLVAVGGKLDVAIAAVQKIMGGRQHLIEHFQRMANADPNDVLWTGRRELHVELEGVDAGEWGVLARSRDGREYRRQWSELPQPKNPHDRVEMAELIEAEIKVATGFAVTLYIQSILPWRTYAAPGTLPRDWPMIPPSVEGA